MKVASTLQRTILYKKSYSDLVKFIESHPAFEVLTVDEEFWQEKTFLDFKVPKWYFNLTSGLLSPSQNYLYFLTQNTLIPESDQVLDLNECFCRAAQMGDLKMTESFLNELKERGVPPNYDKALIDATTGGNMSIIKKLEEISDYRFYNLLIYSCKSGNIEVVRHIYQTVCDENPKKCSK